MRVYAFFYADFYGCVTSDPGRSYLSRLWMIYIFGQYVLDTQRHVLTLTGQPVRLRPKAFAVLVYLLHHRDRVVSKDELCAQVWPEQFISDATLGSTVRAVRQAIEDGEGAPRLI
jgi:adenylate cyclase